MPQAESARRARAYAAYAKRLDGRVVLRRFDPRVDTYDALNALLHRAFARLGALGFNCSCVDQSAAQTREHTLAGECFVALSKGHLLATLTMHAHDPDSPCDPYRSRRVATLGSLAVDPVWQARGIGRSLLAFAERWATAHGATHLALDAPHAAVQLVNFFVHEGFQPIDVRRFAGHCYDSAILCKPVAPAGLAARSSGTLTISPTRRIAAAS